jgi:phosphate:Na+ symporter
LLEKVWPTAPVDEPGRPKYLAPQALGDPSTALDLVPRELGRLFAMVEVSPRPGVGGGGEGDERPAAAQLGGAIEQFCARLASESTLSRDQSLRLQRLRAWLHTLRHIGEAAGEVSASLADLPEPGRKSAGPLVAWVGANIQAGADAVSDFEPEKIRAFHELSKTKSPAFRAMRSDFETACAGMAGQDAATAAAVLENFDILAWLIHRLAKILWKSLGPVTDGVGSQSR